MDNGNHVLDIYTDYPSNLDQTQSVWEANLGCHGIQNVTKLFKDAPPNTGPLHAAPDGVRFWAMDWLHVAVEPEANYSITHDIEEDRVDQATSSTLDSS